MVGRSGLVVRALVGVECELGRVVVEVREALGGVARAGAGAEMRDVDGLGLVASVGGWLQRAVLWRVGEHFVCLLAVVGSLVGLF